MGSLFEGWLVSLNRTRADWPIVAAAGLVTLLAAVLLSAGVIYPSAAAESGLRRALEDAPVAESNIEVSLYARTIDAQAVEDQVQAELQGTIQPAGGSIVRDWRGSATLALPDLPTAATGDQAIVGFLDGVADHATLLEGAWPAARTADTDPMQVVVVDAVANELGLHVGDVLPLGARPAGQLVEIRARLVGIFAVADAGDPYWFGDEQLLLGIHDNGGYRTFGPFLTTIDDLQRHAGVASLSMRWRTFVDYGRVTVDSAPLLRSRVETLPDRLRTATGLTLYVTPGLSSILRVAERSLLVSRTGVLLVMAQLAILAGYAIILTASLLVDHRRVDTSLLRSRGAGPRQVALLAFWEGLLLAVPAVLVAPWLAVAALDLLNVAGPLAEVGLRIVPRVTLGGYVAAGVAGVACVALLVLPAFLAARAFATEQGGLSRQGTRTFGQRMGLDVALLAITGIAIWQLRLYGAPLTRTVQGSLGLDPLLVAAPAIGLLAGGVLALRILPLLAEAVETVISRGPDLLASLSSRQLARRPLRYTRSALLLMLAMSMGVFALSYAATWSSSQRDQAEYQAGADARVRPGTTAKSLPAWALPGAYAGLGGAEVLTAVERMTGAVTLGAAGSADLLALDAGTAAGVVLLRPDESGVPLGGMLDALRAGRPELDLPPLPEGAAFLRVLASIDFDAIGRIEFDETTGEVTIEDVGPDQTIEIRVSANAIVRDAHGLMYRVESETVPFEGPATNLVLDLQPTTAANAGAVAQAGARIAGPIEIAELGIDVWLPDGSGATDGVLGVAGASAGSDAAGPWIDVPLVSAGPWRAKMDQDGQTLEDVSADEAQGTTVRYRRELRGVIFGNGNAGPSARLGFLPESLAGLKATVPVIANAAFLSATAAASGETITAMVEGRNRRLSIGGVVNRFPTTDPDRPLLVLDEATLGLLRLQGTNRTRNADEWWIAAEEGSTGALSGTLRGDPFDSAQVVTVVDRTLGLSTDPVALGIIGALALGFVATGLFAVVGLTVSAAVSARQRRTEFALLRALGLSARQLSGSLWLENGSLVLVSLVGGTGLGLLIGWMVLPFVTVTQLAVAPVPPVIVHVPWDRILLLDGVSALALGVAVLVIGTVLRRLGVGSVLRMGED